MKQPLHRVQTGLVFGLLVLVGAGCASRVAERADLRRIFDEAGVTGATVIYDLHQRQWTTVYGERAADVGFPPASTFKIPNSLIALEDGIVENEYTVFKWDGVRRDRDDVNRDYDLQGAFRNSVMWYFEQIARKVGRERYEYWLARFDYGNRKATGQVAFWLDGDLRISPREQVEFLVRLKRRQLPVLLDNCQTVEHMMLLESNHDYVLRGKTGWARKPSEIGWWVGWVERASDNNVIFFATVIESGSRRPDFGPLRQKITKAVLREVAGVALK